MQKPSTWDIIVIIVAIGMLGWITTDFFGGMFIYFLSYPLIITPVAFTYLISFFETIIALVRKGWNGNRLKIYSHSIVIFVFFIVALVQSELFKSKQVLAATLKDDQFHYTLRFRENGNCENEVNGIFGFHDIYKGKYKLSGDTILFIKKPYDNDFIPDTLLIDKSQKAIFITRDTNRSFIRTKGFLTHLDIHEN